jgi:hypothetical protein
MDANRLLIAAVLLAGCGSEEGAIHAELDFSRRGSLWTAPYPSDLGDGSELAKFPNPDDIELVAQGLEMLSEPHGFAVSGGIFFPLDGAIAVNNAAEHAVLLPLDGGARHPIAARFFEDARPFGPTNLFAILPIQGVPLRAKTRYVAALLRSAGDLAPAELEEEAKNALEPGYRALEAAGIAEDEIAALTIFTTGDPEEAMRAAAEEVLSRVRPVFEGPFIHRETHADFCVYSSTVSMPILFAGASDENEERARVFVTLPRAPMPESGYPTLVFVRTGGGGDRPLIDRGKRASNGGPAIDPGTGPAMEAARAGFAGVSFDGPHGGLRNPNNQDEQFLVFNFLEPAKLRDNVMQSALELILAAQLLEDIQIFSACPGVQLSQSAVLDTSKVAIMGHSMGATIAPLAVAFQPRYRAMILSGAGGSWIENIMYKEKPLNVRPLAEGLLDYNSRGRQLDELDPVLTLVQWAVESADPQVYGRSCADRHVLMLQGIVDHYIMPPIANALSLALELDLAGPALESSLERDLPLAGSSARTLPIEGNQEGRTRVVVQNREDGVEDGHEVVFQTDAPKAMYRCFLRTFAAGTPRVDTGSCP